MNNKLRELLNQAWSSACADAPLRPSCQVKDGNFVFTVKGAVQEDVVRTAGVPSTAVVTTDDDTTTYTWPSRADAIFGADGLFANKLPNYEMRAPQLHMARMTQRMIEMKNKAVVEAGTGTGKGFAYAAVSMAMGRKVVISTSNKALQAQLVTKDLPFLCDTLNGEYTVALAIGKRNYACRKKCESSTDGVTITDSKLAEWYAGTTTGNMEEITFSVDIEDAKKVAIDEHCTGKKCSHYADCFYYEAKAQVFEADVVVCNHALTALNHALPYIEILPEPDVWIIDEAHHLPDYVRSAYSASFTFKTITNAQKTIESYDIAYDDTYRSELALQVQRVIGKSADRQIGLPDELLAGIELANHLRECAFQIWDPCEYPEGIVQRQRNRDAGRVVRTADRIEMCCRKARASFVRWIENGDRIEIVNTPYDVSEYIAEMGGNMTQVAQDPAKCTICQFAFDTDWVYASGSSACCPECLPLFDPMQYDSEEMALADWLALPHEGHQHIEGSVPVMFTSATLAVANSNGYSVEKFQRETGIPLALTMIAESPFDYADNALLYVPNGNTPLPNKDAHRHRAYLVDEIQRLVNASNGGALLLFTSYANLKHCYNALAFDLGINHLVLKQGDVPKSELIRQFEGDGDAVLFATKSFYEGVSIEGEALRLVVMDKLPFAPLTPLANAQSAALKDYARSQLGYTGGQLEFYPFNELSVPTMINDLKQGFGRLIRTRSDSGVVAILDPRLRTTRYGRDNVLPSLPPAKLTDNLALVADRFHTEGTPATSEDIFRLTAQGV